MAELHQYGPFVTRESYLMVFDTIIEHMPEDAFPDKPWGRGDNPATAIAEYLSEEPRFEIDSTIEASLLLTYAPGGYLRCTSGRPHDGR